ncbi:MacB-like core domain-containing protein [Dyadobacter soli]|uniref:MacB-like core domain-containing protein n=1 Tax=Dyadobacter soli TaxID=659014 RepID=A0A1G7U7H3_9BACT|nr:ABC transporter permease [Dyadobacter soli]SDG43328.1 MacB-like core domain-containing protein [Dyadobacter soli]
MIGNYFKTAYRSLQKNRLYSSINLTGLTLGLGVAITLFWIVRFEYSFDRFHAKADRIYRVKSTDKFGEKQSHVHQTTVKLLRTQFPGVESAANFYGMNPAAVQVGTAIFNQNNIFFTEPAMLEMLDVRWIAGNPKQSLGAPGQVVLDEQTAEKLFKGNAMGKQLRYDTQTELTVTGVIGNLPVNTEFPMQMIISWETIKKIQPDLAQEDKLSGGDSMHQGFVLLKPGASTAPIEAALTRFAKSRPEETTVTSVELQPLSEMHFDTSKDPFNYSMPKWMLYTLTSIGIFLIFIACINFVNLATVQAIQRGREVAVRKVLGSGRKQLIFQFFGETGLVVLLATFLGALLAGKLVTYSSELLNTRIDGSTVWNAGTFLFLGVLAIAVTLFAGLYPALILSGFQPVRALQNRVMLPGRGISLRSSLVVLQFVIAQVLVICTLLAMKQIRYFYEKDLGFDKSGIVTVTMPDRSSVLRERFGQQLKQHPEIREVAFGLTTPASKRNHWWGTMKHPGLPDGEETFRLQHIDTNYFHFFRIPLLAGRMLTASDTTRQSKGTQFADVMINEKAARDLGFRKAEKVIGQQLEFWGMKLNVVGVVKDYHSEDLKTKLMPHVYVYAGWNFQLASIRIDNSKKSQAIAHIGEHWKAMFPNHYYEPKFLEDDIKSFYDSERKLSNFLQIFAALGVLIGSLGLFGLVSFVVTQRTKEIGVRKVLGATVYSIVELISRDFLKLMLIAFVIAAPIAWYAMQSFLRDYIYKIDIELWVFVLAAALSVGVALLTISFQSIKAALMNPVKSLRSE